jgi:hypothetical protein
VEVRRLCRVRRQLELQLGDDNLLAFFQWIMPKGWMPGNSTLGQVDYGVELVSTNGVPQTFSFSNFTVSAS